MRDIRKEKGISQNDLADMIGVKRAVISKYETGTISPTIEQLNKIAEALGVDVNWLMHGQTLGERDAVRIEKFTTLFDEVKTEHENATKNIAEKTKLLNTRGRVRLSEYANELYQIQEYQSPKKGAAEGMVNAQQPGKEIVQIAGRGKGLYTAIADVIPDEELSALLWKADEETRKERLKKEKELKNSTEKGDE